MSHKGGLEVSFPAGVACDLADSGKIIIPVAAGSVTNSRHSNSDDSDLDLAFGTIPFGSRHTDVQHMTRTAIQIDTKKV